MLIEASRSANPYLCAMRTPLRYALELNWEGPPGLHYADYGRTYRVRFEGKHDLVGSADPAFRGDPQLPNPEEMFLSSISACHMLTYLALAHGRGLRVAAYRDAPEAELTLEPGGTGTVSCVRLRPSV
ncbi:MAG: OsmC family protein, partial [Myxococcota bacterium]